MRERRIKALKKSMPPCFYYLVRIVEQVDTIPETITFQIVLKALIGFHIPLI